MGASCEPAPSGWNAMLAGCTASLLTSGSSIVADSCFLVCAEQPGSIGDPTHICTVVSPLLYIFVVCVYCVLAFMSNLATGCCVCQGTASAR